VSFFSRTIPKMKIKEEKKIQKKAMYLITIVKAAEKKVF
jgi:hypothetical protein